VQLCAEIGGRMPLTTLVFDAYGTLFDVAGAARIAAEGNPALTEVWPCLAADWRAKQLEYSWLRAVMRDHLDFAEVTADALDWAMEAHAVPRQLRETLLALYETLPAYPEVAGVLAELKPHARLAILSNGTHGMLERACASAGIRGLFDALISVEEVGVYKPSPLTYSQVETRMNVPREQVMFISSNGWDVAGAGRFGFSTVWVNRHGAPIDRLSDRPGAIVPDLTHLPALWGAS
jgi:2-haloacid dehalogenase